MTSFVASHGVYAVFLLMAIDAVLPVASELVMLVGGALASAAFAQHATLFGASLAKGVDTFLAIAAAGTIGYFIGSLAGWAIGRYGGRPLLERHGRWLHLTPHQLARADAWFGRWGSLGVFLGRVTPLVRSFVSVVAGIFATPLRSYIPLTLIGSAVWAFVLAAAGWAAGTRYGTIHHDWRYVEFAIVIAVLCVIGYAFAQRDRRRARTGGVSRR
jgi:membrane protein DedA with SNARE-associated domain